MSVAYDPADLALRLDPYPTYDALRSEDPVHWAEGPGVWLVTRHEDADALLHDARLSSVLSKWERLDHLGPRRPNPALNVTDPPEHTRLRAVVAPLFTAGAIGRLRQRVQAIADELLAAAASCGRVDFMEAVARPLPMRVVCELVGVPAEDVPMIQGWADKIGVAIEPWEQEQAERWPAAQALTQYVADELESQRDEPREGLIAAMLEAEESSRLTGLESLVMSVLVLVSSTQTPRDMLGNGTRALLEAPEQMRRLREDPRLAASATEELLRFDAPMQGIDRVALEPIAVAGRRIEPRQLVRVLLGSANRDPEKFQEPGRLDVGRRPNPHLCFSAGPHYCLGAALGRLEGQVVFGTLASRYPGLRLDGEPVQRRWLTLRGLESLPVAFAGN